MRTIKFRAYNTIEKKMVESGATPTMLHSFFEATAVFNTRDKMEYQQFTGLLDKSGKEIYEGDILRFTSPEADIEGKPVYDYYKVIFRNGGFKIVWLKDEKQETEGADEDLEVIGNIYQNPELLTPNPKV